MDKTIVVVLYTMALFFAGASALVYERALLCSFGSTDDEKFQFVASIVGYAGFFLSLFVWGQNVWHSKLPVCWRIAALGGLLMIFSVLTAYKRIRRRAVRER